MLSTTGTSHKTKLSVSKTSKKRICVTGHLCSPVTKGQPVGYIYNGHTILTAQVEHILEACEDYVTFETINTLYTISYTQIPSAGYTICA